MIKTKKELKHFLKRDAIALRKHNQKRPHLFGDEIWKFQITLRKCEYYSSFSSLKKLLFAPAIILKKFRFKKLSLKLGFSIPLNVFEEGLSIAHYGTIVVNSKAKIGKNCRLQEGANIGATNGSNIAPIIGDNVFIGTGAKIIGEITIANDVAIGANAVVVKSIKESGVTYGGVPAKKISDNNSHSNLCELLFK